MNIERNVRTVLAYIGEEQLAWGRQAFIRHRHYYIMPGILRLAGALERVADDFGFTRPEVLYLNRNVQDLPEMIAATCLVGPAVIGLSCYSWNAVDSLKLAAGIKEAMPDSKVVLGGPGVSFVDPQGSLKLLEMNPHIDAVVRGEGEPVIANLFAALARGFEPAGIPGVSYRWNGRTSISEDEIEPARLADLAGVDYSNVEVKRSASCGLAAVFETYRGCPYKCAYCGFAGGQKGIRRFPLERTMEELDRIFESGIDLIHFADSVFDVGLNRAKAILAHCLANNRRTALFCYASLQSVDDELMDLYEKTKIQIGVGLQSWHAEVLERVCRHFSIERFEKNVDAIAKKDINYYVDIMFGLPGDDMAKFQGTVNRVMELSPPFVMLFPLTLIPGTEMAAGPERWGLKRYGNAEIADRVKPVSGMIYSDIALYEGFGLEDLKRFDAVATALFFSYQRFPLTFRAMNGLRRRPRESNRGADAFAALEKVGAAIAERLGRGPVDVANPPNVEGTVRETLLKIARELGASEEEVLGLESLMRLEAAIAALWSRSDRPSLFNRRKARAEAGPSLDETQTKDVKVAFTAPARLIDTPRRFDSLWRTGEQRRLGRVEKGWSGIALAPWDDWVVRIFELGPLEREILRELEPDREAHIATLERRMKRLRGKADWKEPIENLRRAGIIEIFK